MDILYLLIPMSAMLALGILGVFAWALRAGQFEDLERQAEWILDADAAALDRRQSPGTAAAEESDRAA